MSAAPARPSASIDRCAPLRRRRARATRRAADVDAGLGQRGDEAVAVGAVPDAAGRRRRSTTVLTDAQRDRAPGRARRPRRRRPPCAASSPTARRCRASRIAVERRAGRARRRPRTRRTTSRRPAAANAGVVHRRRQAVARPASRSTAASRRARRRSRPSRPAARRRCRRWPRAARRDGEGVVAVLVGEHVVQVHALVGSGRSAHSGSPALGLGAGLQRGLDRRPARVGDRRRRQPGVAGTCCTGPSIWRSSENGRRRVDAGLAWP